MKTPAKYEKRSARMRLYLKQRGRLRGGADNKSKMALHNSGQERVSFARQRGYLL
jgi:hypothetical protein